jgi:phosphonatase-like hydrolase
MSTQMPSLVLFDIAGTLVGDTGLTIGAYQSVLDAYGLAVDPHWLGDRIGCQKAAVFAEVLHLAGRNDVDPQTLASSFSVAINASIELDPPPVLPGVAEAFAILRARGCLCGLVTGFHTSTAQQLRDEAGWDPDVIVGSDEVAAGRPAPDLVIEAMRRVGLDEVSLVASVGDTPRDLDMANAAECGWNIGVATGSYSVDALLERPHTAVLSSMHELPAALGMV